jgi:periplasmic divalent cation tolerance protein
MQVSPTAGSRLKLVLTTLPDREDAERIARALVGERLAACVSILAPATSVYRWGGVVETAREWPLLIKAPADRLPALQQTLQALHPYEVPEIVALDVCDVLPAYLRWALEACEPSPDAPRVSGNG